MKALLKSQSLTVGLAMFSMFFGAGNVIFPLAVGQYATDKNFYAICGLILTAAIMPIAGVIAMILFNGNTKEFFGRLGRGPGFILALMMISLLGPLGSTPRCIALSYTTLKGSFLDMPPYLFSAAACGVIFLFTFRKNQILNLLGWVLTPIMLISLITIILIGLFTPFEMTHQDQSNLSLFTYGLKEGYNTMDLLAAFFFSSTILSLLREQGTSSHVKTALQASMIGAILLGGVYIGFSYLAAFHGANLDIGGKDALLSALTVKIAGPYAGILVNVTIASACLTTAIALISAFTSFIKEEVVKEKLSYRMILLGSVVLTFFVATFEFTKISAFLAPILQVCYPGLIVFTLLNIAYRLKNFKPIRVPVFAVFALSTILFFYN